MTASFWGSLAYWTLLVSLLVIFITLLTFIKDSWKRLKIIRRPATSLHDPKQPFCARVEVKLEGQALTSPLLKKSCLYFSSQITKHYSRQISKNYYEDSQQANFQMRCGSFTFLPPEPEENPTYLQPKYQFNKKFLSGSLPAQLEANLRQLELKENFWKGLRKTSIDFDEELMPVETHLWVFGRLQDEDTSKPLRLTKIKEGIPPIVGQSHKQLKQHSFYELVSYSSATLGVAIFSLVAAYVLY